MPLPYLPETLQRLKGRIDAALARTFHVQAIKEGAMAPWETRANVLDFESGLRLIVSKEAIEPDAGPCIHVVGCIIPGTMLDHDLWMLQKKERLHPEEHLRKMIPGQFAELHPSPLEFLGFSDGGIPHFYGALEWSGSRTVKVSGGRKTAASTSLK